MEEYLLKRYSVAPVLLSYYCHDVNIKFMKENLLMHNIAKQNGFLWLLLGFYGKKRTCCISLYVYVDKGIKKVEIL